jgi:type I restriction enzyme M protein
MNLAVHGLEGKIAEAITYYQDEHSLFGKCDFVMANPPFNVDLVDAKKIEGERRLPFGLPGVNKGGKVSNGNYLWISYFWAYLNEKGRAGFVMSSQASSAGHGEKDVRRKIVETGDVDVMISIRSNFFYTRTVPCELWHFDRSKPTNRRDKVLMLDARNVYRKVTRKIYDFSPEQMHNLAAIVWLYRGQKERFLRLVADYLARVCSESSAVPGALAAFDATLAGLRGRTDAFATAIASEPDVDGGKKQHFEAATMELDEAAALYEADRQVLLAGLRAYVEHNAASSTVENSAQHAARQAFDPLAESIRGLIRQVDLLYKLATRVTDAATDVATEDVLAEKYDRRAAAKLVKQLDEERKAAVAQLADVAYFHRQVAWLQDRFPAAELRAVPGLVRLVDIKDIEAADWSLTPGRYVGVAPPEVDEDFDFEQTLRDIHIELADLNREAADLASKIQENFRELGV